MDRHFLCTACGKCCYGLLPLLLDEALTHAGRFPLAMLWTVLPAASRSAGLVSRLGASVTVGRRRTLAVEIGAVAWLPDTLTCPELTPDGLCAIHDDKPQRCRTMPFYAAREEAEQDSFLLPRPGWRCDISRTAPLVYRDGTITDRTAFDAERHRLEDQAAIINAYAHRLLAQSPALARDLDMLGKRSGGGRLALPFTAILPRLNADIAAFARQQVPVLRAVAARTAGDTAARAFHTYYAATLRALEPFADAPLDSG